MKKLILLFGTLISNILFAQWTDNYSINTLVSDSETAEVQSFGTNDGKTYVLFLEPNSDAYNLKVQLLDSEGNQQFGSEGISVSGVSTTNDFTAAVDEEGNIYAAFVATDTQGRINKISPSGEQLWGEEGVSLSLSAAQIRVLPTPDGGAVIGWLHNITTATLMKYDSEGVPEWDEVKTISSPDSGPYTSVGELTLLSEGSFVVLFHTRDLFFLPDSRMWAQRYDSGGNEIWDAPIQLSDHTTAYNTRYSLAQNGDVVYVGYYGHLGRYDSYLQRINPDGTLPWGINGSDFSTSSDFYEMNTSIAYEEGSDYVWAISHFTNMTQSEYGEYIQKFHKESGARYLSDDAEKVFEVSADGYVHYGGLQLVYGKPFFLFSTLVDPTFLSVTYMDEMGGFIWEQEHNVIAMSANDKSSIGFTKNTNGQSIAVWMETRNPADGNRAYVQNFRIGGDGCLNAPQGQYPTEVLIPDCVTGWPVGAQERPGAGEYSLVEVANGRSYFFESTTLSDFITISDEAGTTVLITGIGTLNWTADFDGIIRFYVHADAECNWDDDVFRNRYVSCFDPIEQEYDCDQNYAIVGDVGFGINNVFGWYTANDFFVPMESEQYRINSIRVNLGLIATIFPDTTFDISILNDNNGSPGTVIETFTAQPPSLVENGETPWRYYVTFDLGEYELPVNAEEDTRYWVSLTTANADMMSWLSAPYVEGWETEKTYQSNGGTDWQPVVFEDSFYDGTWSIDASCETMGASDMSAFDFSYYPNPVKDILNISSQKPVESISVHNMAGQQLLHKINVNSGQIDLTSLPFGVYVFRVVLGGGQIETFKIIKK